MTDAQQAWTWGWAWGPDTWWMTIIRIVVFLALFAIIWVSLTDWVPFGHEAIKCRRGQIRRYRFGKRKGQPIIVGPGFRFSVVKWDQLHKVDKRRQTHKLEPLIIDMKMGQIYLVTFVVYTVIDIVPSAVEHMDVHLHMLTTSQETLSELKRANTPLDDLREAFLAKQKDKAKPFGVNFEHFGIFTDNPTEATQNAKAWGDYGFQLHHHQAAETQDA